MTTKQPRKPRAKKTAKPTVAPAGDTFEAMMGAIVTQKAEKEEFICQTHLQKRAWQLFGHLVMDGVFRLPDFDKLEDKDVIAEVQWLEGCISSLVMAFHEMRLLDDEF